MLEIRDKIMTSQDLQKLKLPDAPGVYFFLGKRKKILYIGKATSLRSRVRSYFADDILEKRSALIEQMVAEAETVEWTETDSVLEALILEANLIRTHKPRYNTIAKDDKTFNHLVITNEEYPRVLVVRGKDLTERFTTKEIKYIFGPFPSGMLFREALAIVRKIFKFYDTERPIGEIKTKMGKGTIDFNRQIGLYPSVQSKREYQRTIQHIRLFFEGKKHQLIKILTKEMREYARTQAFEKAGEIKRKIFALTHIEDVALVRRDMYRNRGSRATRIEAYDIAHMSGKDMVGVMTVVENGEVRTSEYRKFKIGSVKSSNDPAALREVLDRRLAHAEWPMPQMIVVDGGRAQKNAAELILKKYGIGIPVVAVTKDEYHRPKRLLGTQTLIREHEDSILLANVESHRFAIAYHRQKRGKFV
ncbi:GIY-YIG nuclease family protein [Candidatus Kaiserbacteria bacterium]|nr:GIY-YIG nuclease family protein [Candidatus Kaiserbacteria bacterium]